jgi:outer membrane biosynthesis protein TonB
MVLQPFVTAARAAAEADVAAAAPPPARRTERRRSVVRWRPLVPFVAALLVAAVVLLVIAPDRRPEAPAQQPSPSQAASSLDDARPAAQFETRQPSPPRTRTPSPLPVRPEDEVIEIEPEPAPEARPPSRPKPTPESKPPPAVEEQAEPLADRLARLDALAQKQLGDGKVDAADRTLAELIKLGGKRRLVELAYGDRFTLAHRRGDTAKQVSLWSAYLRRFPSGRLADDARAGLCRHTARGRRDGCWRAYLRDFPRGAYSEQAHRELAAGGPGTP